MAFAIKTLQRPQPQSIAHCDRRGVVLDWPWAENGVKIALCKTSERTWPGFCAPVERFSCSPAREFPLAAAFPISAGRRECGKSASRFITTILCERKQRA